MEELIIQVQNVSKRYRLGMIGRTTLKEDILRLKARRRNQPDPTRKVTAKQTHEYGDTFLALDGISFEVKKGEALGIIGHNGAGKSTLLKLITRITAPTGGIIRLGGRVASLLEVGTGFHPELTGRENIYLNGAILGMTRAEIDERIEDIIEFSECRKFIDTPVKRYSSGMNVKLGFSIAAHLNAEIMIMDEVLAVGDVAFQNKCIKKMREVANSGKTILYVSHNMATIRSLCDRCIVLSAGRLIYEGDVEEAISHYIVSNREAGDAFDLSVSPRPRRTSQAVHMNRLEFLSGMKGVFSMGDSIRLRLSWSAKRKLDRLKLRIGVFTADQTAVGIAYTDPFVCEEGEHEQIFSLDVSRLLPGKYCLGLMMVERDHAGNEVKHDEVNREVIMVEIHQTDGRSKLKASPTTGYYQLPTITCEDRI